MQKQPINPEELFNSIKESLQSVANAEKAPAMERYMKNKFSFYGVSAPERKLIVNQVNKSYLMENSESFWKLINLLWQDKYRECQYFAVDLLIKSAKKMGLGEIEKLEKFILEKSWWDTVDALAANVVGVILKEHPEELQQKTAIWANGPELWLNRTAIIVQLKYGVKTNWTLLQNIILTTIKSKDFFIRKAQGWALRQYAKYYPERVYEFVNTYPELSTLTKKEALKNTHPL